MSWPADMNVGFVGLGHQGAPIARLIARSDLSLHVWGRRPETVEPFRGLADSVAVSLAELGENCDIIGICVVDDAGLQDVVLDSGLLDVMRPDSVITIHSTVDQRTCNEIAEAAARKNVDVLDAPVSRKAVDTQRYTIFVGGEEDVFDRALPMLQSFGDHISLLGPIGAGQRAKVVNNVLLLANMQLGLQALALGDELGLDRRLFGETVSKASGTSFALDILIGDPESRPDVPRLMRKDFEILTTELTIDPSREPTLLRLARDLLSEMKKDPHSWAPSWYPA